MPAKQYPWIIENQPSFDELLVHVDLMNQKMDRMLSRLDAMVLTLEALAHPSQTLFWIGILMAGMAGTGLGVLLAQLIGAMVT